MWRLSAVRFRSRAGWAPRFVRLRDSLLRALRSTSDVDFATSRSSYAVTRRMPRTGGTANGESHGCPARAVGGGAQAVPDQGKAAYPPAGSAHSGASGVAVGAGRKAVHL